MYDKSFSLFLIRQIFLERKNKRARSRPRAAIRHSSRIGTTFVSARGERARAKGRLLRMPPSYRYWLYCCTLCIVTASPLFPPVATTSPPLCRLSLSFSSSFSFSLSRRYSTSCLSAFNFSPDTSIADSDSALAFVGNSWPRREPRLCFGHLNSSTHGNATRRSSRAQNQDRFAGRNSRFAGRLCNFYYALYTSKKMKGKDPYLLVGTMLA